MSTITLKNIPQELLVALKERAHTHRRSLNREVIFLLERSVEASAPDREQARRKIDLLRERLRGRVFLTDADLRKAREDGRP